MFKVSSTLCLHERSKTYAFTEANQEAKRSFQSDIFNKKTPVSPFLSERQAPK